MKKTVSIFQFGIGGVGQAFIEQVLLKYVQLRQKEIGLELNIFDSTHYLTFKVPEKKALLSELLLLKKEGKKLKDFPGAKKRTQSENVFTKENKHKIFLDLTASEKMVPIIQQALKNNCHLVLANKKGLAGSNDSFFSLQELAKKKGLSIKYETTVGAGLPIVQILKNLIRSGDKIVSIKGLLSGTLVFLFSQMEKGKDFSVVLRDAKEKGYTEPDPREDLSGLDVARKLSILVRTIGRECSINKLELPSLYSKELNKLPLNQFLKELESEDKKWRGKNRQSFEKGRVLRYLATWNFRRGINIIDIGVKEIDSNSILGALEGTDNYFEVLTCDYSNRPLILTGPGAGVTVTAAGVWSDLLAIILEEIL